MGRLTRGDEHGVSTNGNEEAINGRITIGIIRPVNEFVAIAHAGESLANCSHVWIALSAWHTPEASFTAEINAKRSLQPSKSLRHSEWPNGLDGIRIGVIGI